MEEILKIWHNSYDELVKDKGSYYVIRHSKGKANRESISYDTHQKAIAAYQSDRIVWQTKEEE